MNDKNKLNMMDGIDDELIDRANPENIKKKPKKKLHFRYGMIAACLLCAVLAINLAIFLPMALGEDPIADDENDENDDIPEEPQGQTYDSIKKIIESYNGYKNDNLTNSMGSAAGTPEMGNDSTYVEVTDNQVQGVIEADIFKRTKSHIFYLRGNKLCAYSINGEDSALVGELQVISNYVSNREMYLSTDGKRAIIIYTATEGYRSVTKIVTVNVENPGQMSLMKSSSFTGSYVGSRYTNGDLLLFTRFYVTDTKKEENFIPSVNTGSGYKLLAPNCIVAPNNISSTSYITVSKLKSNGDSYCGSVALLSYDDTIYVSGESAYVARSIYESKTDGEYQTYKNKSEIARISYKGDTVSTKGIATVNGTVKDQYCMDEHNGILRVFATVTEGYYKTYYNGNSSSSSSGSVSGGASGSVGGSAGGGTISPSIGAAEPSPSPSAKNSSPVITPMAYEKESERIVSASLYCISIDTMKVKASKESFAPQGETVQSARFDGNTAYVCTAIVFTDPVFVFDLSDLNNITYKDTGDIEGYSHSLIELSDGYLLGIGQVGWTTLKLELYLEAETGLSSVSKVEIANAYSTSTYKAHYINREEMVFGFAYAQYGEKTKTVYSVFKIIDGKITTVKEFNIGEKAVFDQCRGVLIDDYFYVLTDADTNNFLVSKIK